MERREKEEMGQDWKSGFLYTDGLWVEVRRDIRGGEWEWVATGKAPRQGGPGGSKQGEGKKKQATLGGSTFEWERNRS